MKSFPKKPLVIAALLLAAGITGMTLVHAQTAMIPSSPANLPSLESYSDAQLEQVLNELAAMPLIWPTNLPDDGMGGTYWSLAHPDWPPLPSASGTPVWEVSSNFLLLDDIDYPETVSANSGAMAMFSPMDSGGGGDSPAFNFSFPTNGLYLQITNVADNVVYANLNNATDFVYQIFSLTNLSMATAVSNWNTETEVFPGMNTNVMPFTVSMNGRNPLFLWARDWTGITNGGNETPSWWFWEYYGTTDLSDTNLDSQGNTLLYDYQHGINPNPFIGFSAQFPNNVQTSTFDATVTVYSGEPFYEAVLVNDTNAADAVWQPYSGTNIAVTLNSSNGIYTVSVGLRGFPSNAAATWVPAQVTLENLAPTLMVTSPASGTVSQPVIQVQGLVSETLSNLTYDVSNALGLVSNQRGYWSPSYFDTNVDDFTMNTFQCYDVQLANGMNTITLHATDAQDNTATASVNYTLDYSAATPPALSVLWPPNGTAISGSNFTLQAQVDDDTAAVTAQIADSNGDMNTVQGLVERSGLVLVNNLPLAAGTNVLIVIATDAAGLSATNNLTVVQSSALVTIDPLNQPNQSTVSVTGTISDPTCTLTVNGTNAYYLDDEGDWEADNVPVSPTGTATLDVEVYSGDPMNIGSQIFAVAQPPVVAMMSYTKNTYQGGTAYNYCDAGTANASSSGTETVQWLYQSGGSDTSSSGGINGDCQPFNLSGTTSLAGGYNGYSPTWEIDSSQSSYYDFFFYFLNHPVYQVGSDSYTANTKVMVMPADQASVGQAALYLIGAQVFDEDTGNQLPASALQFANQVPGTMAIDVTNGSSVVTEFLAAGPAATNLEVTPVSAGRNISFNPPWTATNMTPNIMANGITLDPDDVATNANFCVGQSITFSLSTPPSGLMATNFQWTFSGVYYNRSSNSVPGETFPACSRTFYVDTNRLTSNTPSAFWVSGGTANENDPNGANVPQTYSASCSYNLIPANGNGSPINMTSQGKFNMFRPQARITPQTPVPVTVANSAVGPLLIFGYPGTANGIIFSNSITCPTNFSGSVAWVQVCLSTVFSAEDTNSITYNYVVPTPGPYLDTSIPYNNYVGTNPVDGPFIPLGSTFYQQESRSDSFEMWMLFRPNNAAGTSYPVPLRAVYWSWSGTATNSLNGWGLQSGTNTPNPSDFDIEEYPSWSNNVTNGVFMPALPQPL
jgi:hypothetical protein